MMTLLRKAGLPLLVCLFVLSGALPVRAQGSTFTVTKTADTNDGACTAQDCSLREAIIAANAAPGSTVSIPAGLYALSITGTGEDSAAAGDLDITADMTITGAGRDSTIIDANGIDRVFHITGTYTVSISGVTISGGSLTSTSGVSGLDHGAGINNYGGLLLSDSIVSGNSTYALGGGIFGFGSTTITNTIVSDNRAYSGGGFSGGSLTINDSAILNNTASLGAGISNAGSRITIHNSHISGNTASREGGGIYNRGIVTITNSSLSDNTSLYSDAGGIYGYLSTITVANSTLSGNSAHGYGGGIYHYGGTLTLTNTTISANSVLFRGGGLQLLAGIVSITHVTIADNAAYEGGNIAIGGAAVTINNTIIARSSDGANCSGNINISGGNNLTDDDTCGIGFINSPSIQLGLPNNYGGPTPTIPLLASSSAIDAAEASLCPATDQRGVARPQGAGCDIGAFELVYEPSPPNAIPARNVYTTATPTLRWGAVTWAAGYEVQVASDARFTQMAFTTTTSASTLEVTTGALSEGAYYWRVRAQRSDGRWGVWSAADTFVIDLP